MMIRKTGPSRQASVFPSLVNADLAITYGTVESNNTNGTCVVKLITGFSLPIKIPSEFPPGKEPSTGGVRYPRVGSRVVIIHPKNDIGSGFVFPATFDIRDEAVISDLLETGDKSVSDDGWTTTRNREDGTVIISREDYTITIDVTNQITSIEDWHGNSEVLDSDGIKLNGEGNTLTKYSPLDSALQGLVSAIKTELGKIANGISGAGGSYTPGTLSLDTSDANAASLHTE
jgi:hypothetical protein